MALVASRWFAWLAAASLASVSFAIPVQSRSTDAGIVPSLSGPSNVIAAGTYPRANFLKDGSILAAYTAFANGDNIITVSRSTNRGVTWTPIGMVDQGPSATRDVDNPYPLQLPSGQILVAFRNHDRQNGSYTFFRITICSSDDNGANWKFLSQPASDPGPTNGNWEPFLRNAADGSLQLYYSRENSGTDQDSLMRTSRDGGITWSTATTISGGEFNNARDGMLGVATVNGANLIAVFETSQYGLFTVNSITSSDDGKTWGNRQRVYTPTGQNNNAGAPQVINVGGTLVVSFMTDEDTQLHEWIQGASAKLVTSGDGGRTWGNKITFSDVQSNWPGLLMLDGGSFLAMADNNGAKAQTVTLH